jgi:hypothetical protein
MASGRSEVGGRVAKALAVGLVVFAIALPWTSAEETAARVALAAAVAAAALLLALALVAPVATRWSGATIAVLAIVAYAGVVAELVLRPGTMRAAGPGAIAAGLVLVAIPALRLVLRARGRAPLEPVSLAEDDPLVAEAVGRARASFSTFRRLRAEDAGPAAVKLVVTTDAGARERVWAEVVALRLDDVVARPLSRPATQRGALPPTVTVPLAAIEDWQITLPDGAVRGSFSTLAMIAACERDGLPVPPAVRRVRFLDGATPVPVLARGAGA